jgi:hypothetical protein
MIQAAFIFSIALLSFVDDADQLLVERVHVRRRASRLDEVSVVSLALAAQPMGHWLLAVAEIRVNHHSRCGVWPASFAGKFAQDRIDQWAQPSRHKLALDYFAA